MKTIIDKIRARGIENLTDAELLSLIVGDSGDAETLLAYSEQIIDSVGGIGELAHAEFSRLRMVAGMGAQRAARLAATAELGRRMAAKKALRRESISSEADVVALFRPRLEALQHEECWALLLSSSNGILEQMRVSQGGVQATVVDHRLVVKRALELLATRIILVHNHPSGSAEPSEQDKSLTAKINSAASLFDIQLLDHIIISRSGNFSFRASGLLK